jgi:[ribosomal protein S5]-alanine N-acetyltransferase
MPTVIETDRPRLENWQPEALAAFRPIATHPKVMRYVADGKPWPDERIAPFISRQITHAEWLSYCLWKLVDKTSDRLVGQCGIQPLYNTGETEIGWRLARDCWGRGLASGAAYTALRYGFDVLGLPRTVAIAQPENVASIRVRQGLGRGFVSNTTIGERAQFDSTIRLALYAIDHT